MHIRSDLGSVTMGKFCGLFPRFATRSPGH